MKNLESKQMPFRTIDEFYKPFYKEKVAEGIKVFPKSNPQNIILPKGQLPSIISYLSGLNAAKQLPRRIYNRQQYFSVPKKCKKLNQKSLLSINNQTVQQNSRDQRLTKIHLSTINSINTSSNSSFSINRLKFNEGKHLQSLKNQFNQTIREKSDNKQLKYSFYNTLQKNEYFHKSFYRDNCLTQRKTAKFQNTFRRNIHAQQILKILEKSKEKLRTGI